MADPDKLTLRKGVKAWSVEARRRRALYEAATDARHRAMYEARVAGFPLDTIAADAELLDLLAVYRTVQSWTTDSPVIDLLDDDIDSDTNNHH